MTIADDLTTFKPLTTDMMYTTMSSWTNEQYFGSITRLTRCVVLSTSVSSSHPPHVRKDEDPNKGRCGGMYIATAGMVLLVTVLVIIVVVLACMLQQRRSKDAMDELHMKKINRDSQVYSGTQCTL